MAKRARIQRPVAARPRLLVREGLASQPRQRRSIDNRTRLKEAALRLFGRQGYEKTSINDIAAEATLAVGGFYLHFRSKRQLLLVLMDDLLQALADVDLQPGAITDPRTAIRDLLSRAFARDLQFLGAYRAWQEAILTDAELARKQRQINKWTTERVLRTFRFLQTLPGARPGADLEQLARVMDTFFWALLAEALRAPRTELDDWLDAATHLVFHALFLDRAKG
jgi:AcrR family transcriptional regulator